MIDPILYIEDEPDDIFFMQRAFKKIAPEVKLLVIRDGQEAADFFKTAAVGSEPVIPLTLVILDLNLPGRSGLDVLAQIRQSTRFSTVPVLLFSASNQQSDIDSGYSVGCNAYLVKPAEPERLKSLVSLINDFWLKENRYAKTTGRVAIVSS